MCRGPKIVFTCFILLLFEQEHKLNGEGSTPANKTICLFAVKKKIAGAIYYNSINTQEKLINQDDHPVSFDFLAWYKSNTFLKNKAYGCFFMARKCPRLQLKLKHCTLWGMRDYCIFEKGQSSSNGFFKNG